MGVTTLAGRLECSEAQRGKTGRIHEEGRKVAQLSPHERCLRIRQNLRWWSQKDHPKMCLDKEGHSGLALIQPLLRTPTSHTRVSGTKSQFRCLAHFLLMHPRGRRGWSSGYWLWPGPALVVAGIWGVKHWMEDLYVSLLVSL